MRHRLVLSKLKTVLTFCVTQSPVSHRHTLREPRLLRCAGSTLRGDLVSSRPLANDPLVELGAVAFGYSPRHVPSRLPYTAVEVSGSAPPNLGSSLSIGPVTPQPTGTTAVPGHRTTSKEVGDGTPPGAVGWRRETPSLNQRRTEIVKGLPLIEDAAPLHPIGRFSALCLLFKDRLRTSAEPLINI